ncbi:hypothetical protein LOAG_08043 [Loa loa]|uniref:Uncharacterized protein n=1 Tax=Loa loa TaxID=7209 RepID=A0A1S0TUJ5_LOALO|nr:hypothetical protein LOAG_08043 [Loa loa]EFO20445.1 hypothetical protein LOAG_08043 [Loa loa]
MDEHAVNDIEMDGIFIGNNYIHEMLSPNNSGYFALQTVHSTVRIHYIQSTGYYAIHILSDTLENGFYQYFVTLNSYPYIIEKVEQKLQTTTAIIQEIFSKKTEKKLITKSLAKINYKPFIIDKNDNETIVLNHHIVTHPNGLIEEDGYVHRMTCNTFL